LLAERKPGRAMARLQTALPTILMVAAIAFLAFVYGNYVMFASAFPATYLADAFKGGRALMAKKRNWDKPFPTELWQPARRDATGVTVHDPARAFQGYTLYTSGHDQTALLIDMAGNVAHEWNLKYSDIWDDSAYVRAPQPDRLLYYRKAWLYPNGDLLAIYEAVGDTPWGYGVVKMDKDSTLIWKYLEPTHHDLDVGSDGRIYLLTHYFNDTIIENWGHLRPPRLDDWVVVLSPEGEELQRTPVTDTFIASPYARMVNTVAWYLVSSLSWQGSGDFFHTNGIDVLDPKRAADLAPGAKWPVMLSMREIGAIGIIDLADGRWHWATQGPWLGQHDPDLLPNGDILLFDNFGHYGDGNISRVMEFDPNTLGMAWVYAGDEQQPFYSNVRSAQERLPNGNTLITESDGGRLFEVTRDREIVWEYLNPVRGGENDQFIPVVSWGQRFAPDALEPAFLELIEQKESDG
jgi:Arylsulfotransferase (ASST)